MKMKILIMIIISILPMYSFAQCKDISDEFKSTWEVKKETIKINIERKDRKEFIFYNIRGVAGKIFTGYKFSNGQKISKINGVDNIINILVDYRGNSIKEEKQIMNNLNLLIIDNNKLVTTGLSDENIKLSQIYEFPLGEYFKQSVKSFNDQFNISYNIKFFNKELVNNKVFGKQKIKFYVHLIHDNKVMSCSKFESPEIEYNFGMKP